MTARHACTTVRVVQYNTHRFLDKDDQDTASQIIEDLASLEPSIVTLNEVDLRKQPGVLERLEKSLGMKSTFFGHMRGHYGNALLSKYPVRSNSVQEIMLNGGTQVEWPAGSGENYRIQRGLVVAELDVTIDGTGESLALGVACTHLDHIKEEERVTQMAHVLQVLRGLDVPHLLMGDFNALHRSDYSAEQWAMHEAHNQEQGWAPPADSSASGNTLWQLAGHGYTDCFLASSSGGSKRSRFGHRGGNGGCSDAVNPSNGSSSAHGHDHGHTAHVGRPRYRIDYVYASPGMVAPVPQAEVARAAAEPEKAPWGVARAWVDSTATGSDHFPLVVDLTPYLCEAQGSSL